MSTSLPPGAGKNLGLSAAQISNSITNLDSISTTNYNEQQQIPCDLNVNVSNQQQANSAFNPNQQTTSPKEQKPQIQQLQQLQQPNTNFNASMRSNSINNLAQPANSSTSSTSTILDQTTATISDLISGEETDSEEKKSIDDKGIKSRIELAMDLVKSHLTSAVNQEIVFLKNQINQLTEKCSRLEKENQILKKNASPDTLELLSEAASSSTASRSRDPSNVNTSAISSQHNPPKQAQ